MSKYDSILLYSGGLDSYIAWHYLGHPQTVFFDIGHKYAAMEKRYVKKNAPKTIVDESMQLGDIEDSEFHAHGVAYIPYRNLLLITLAAAKYSDNIFIGGVRDDSIRDNNVEFFRDLSFMLCKIAGRPIKVSSPFLPEMGKNDIVEWYKSNVGSLESLHSATFSCYSGGQAHACGKCGACFRKWLALYSAGHDIGYKNVDQMRATHALMCDPSYRVDEKRREATLKALESFI